ncbi:MAG TPA: methyl-accepting chemotaxis protein, partial [Gammaproteobacteria bacterium]|nr:methyl-accepting chemotaxis protein [Gammaproteobacteria bacterium]
MKTMFDVKTLGASNRIKVLTVLMLCAIWAMAWTFVQVGKQAESRQARLADVGEQMVLSQRVAKYALAASAGDVDAFAKMESFKNEFTHILVRQMSDFGSDSPMAGTAESQALLDLENRWSGFSDNIDEVLQGQFLILAMAEASSLLNEVMPQLMGHTQDIVDILVKNDASAEQVRLASRQAVLVQRIVNSLNAVMRGVDTESAALSFGTDTKEFGRVLDGFMRGTGGIESLKGATLRSKIQEIALLFSRVSDNVGSIVENAEELVGIQSAVAEITGKSEVLFDAASNLRDVLAESRRDSIISNELAYALGAVALLILLWMAFEALRTQRQRSRMVERENVANQEAIMRLIDEMGDLAEGDLTVRATVTEEFTGAIADSINVTVDSLRGLVKTINDTSMRLSNAVQETEETATNLSQESKQQAQDITVATASISEMSASMEEVSRHADESSKVAMRSVEIAKNGGEAVQRTMQGMDTIREHIQETSKRIKRLGESSQEIGDIVELINDIAEQTNILALNASIQAA